MSKMDTRQQLAKAFELIQSDKFDEANNLLKPILKAEPNNADAWWLYANTLEDPRKAREALVNVLKHNPKHVQARETLDQLNEQVPPRDDELEMLIDLDNLHDDLAIDTVSDDEMFKLFSGEEDIDLNFDDLEEKKSSSDDLEGLDDDLFSELLKEEKRPRRETRTRERRSLLLPVTVILLAALVATLLFVLTSESDDEANTGTPDLTQLVAVQVNESPNLDTVVNNVTESAKNTPNFSPDSAAVLTTTGDSQALFVQTCVCLQPQCQGPSADKLSDIILEGFKLVAAGIVNSGATAEIPMAGVNIQSCGSSDIVYRAYTTVESVQNYRGNDNLESFRAIWNIE